MIRITAILLVVFIATTASAQVFDVLKYNINIELSDSTDRIEAYVTVEGKINRAADFIEMDLSALRPDGKGMQVDSIYGFLYPLKGPITKQKLGFTHAGERLHIQTGRLNPGAKYHLAISYSGIPPDGLIISKNKFGQRTFFGDNWPNRAHHWFPCNDRPDDKAMVSFEIFAPKGYLVIANGDQLVYRPSTPTHNRHAWVQFEPISTKVIVFGAAPFVKKEFNEKPGGIPVSAWVYPQDSTKGFHDFSLAVPALKFFQNYIGPYPFSKLANVQSTTIFGGMENASAIFYDQHLVTGDGLAEATIVHEIVHQWFGNMATEKSFAHLWLSEGFATYLTDYYIEKKYGIDSARKRLIDERRQVIQFARLNKRPVVDTTKDLMELLNANSYQKGAWILHMLRKQTGDATFQKILRTYYQKFKGKNAESHDFQKVVEAVTKKNWDAFFGTWLHMPGVPRVTAMWNWKAGQLNVILNAERNIRPGLAPYTIAYNTASGKTIRKKIAWHAKPTVLKIPVPEEVRSVMIDPDVETLLEGVVVGGK